MGKCIAPPRGNQRGQQFVMDLGGGKCRVVYWDGQEWQDGDGSKICHCDACSPPKPVSPSAIEGSLMDMERRIKYDDKRGCWRVIFNGKVTTDELKTSGEAYQLMSEFISKKKEPKY